MPGPEPQDQYNFTDPESPIMKNGTGFEQSPDGTATGTTVLAALDRNGHHRSVSDQEAKADPPAPQPGASVNETMRHRLQTAAGKKLDKLRR